MKPTYIPTSQIQVVDRQRTDVSLDDAFLDSIKERGIIQPIVIDTNFRLIAGGRRLAAAMQLGMQTVPIVVRETLNNEERELLELEENVRRRDLSWQDRCKAVARIHALRVIANRDEGWTQKQTGELIGESSGSVQYLLQLARELRDNPNSEVAEADGYREAIRRMVASREAEAQNELNKRLAESGGPVKPRIIQPMPEGTPLVTTSAPTPAPSAVASTKVFLSNRAVKDNFARLKPDEWPDKFFPLVIVNGEPLENCFYETLYRTLKPNGLVFFQVPYEETASVIYKLDKGGIPAYGTPIIWNRIGESDYDRDWPFAPNYTCFVYASKEAPHILQRAPTSVITTPFGNPGELPFGVIEFLLKPTTIQNQGVTLVGYGPETAVSLAKLGRVPLAIEPDEAKYAAIRSALEAHYRETVPGVVFE